MEFLCLDCCKTFLTALIQRKRYNSHLEQYQSLESGRDCERNCQVSVLMKSFIFFLGFIKNKWFYPSTICHKLNNEKKAKTFDIRCLFTPVIISCYYKMNGFSLNSLQHPMTKFHYVDSFMFLQKTIYLRFQGQFG